MARGPLPDIAAQTPARPLSESRHRLRLEAALWGTILVWGANFPIFKFALRSLPPLQANVVRFAVALSVLVAFYWLTTTDAWPALRTNLRRYGWHLFGLSLLGYVLYQLGFVIGIHRTSASSAALIMASSPLWTALLARMTGIERFSGGQWSGLIVSLCGTALVVLGTARPSAAPSADTLVGNLIILGAAVLWAMYTTFSKPLLSRVGATTVTLVEIVMAYPFLIAAALFEPAGSGLAPVTPLVWLALIYSGGLSTGLTIVVWNSAVRQVGPASTATYSNFVPLFAAVFSLLLLDEPITIWQIGGGIVLITGLFILRRSKRVPVRPATAAI